MVYKLESQNKEQELVIGELKTENSAQKMKTRRLENRLKSLQVGIGHHLSKTPYISKILVEIIPLWVTS